jgi:hypothetical protein
LSAAISERVGITFVVAVIFGLVGLDHPPHHPLGAAHRPLLVDRDLGGDRVVDRELAVVAGGS